MVLKGVRKFVREKRVRGLKRRIKKFFKEYKEVTQLSHTEIGRYALI